MRCLVGCIVGLLLSRIVFKSGKLWFEVNDACN